MKKISLLIFIILFFGAVFFAQNTPLIILDKPKPEIPEDYDTLDVQGTVRLRVEFLSNSQIRNVFSITSLPYGLTEKALEAAKKIKFEPEMKNGEPETIFEQVEYFYGWDGGWGGPSKKNSQRNQTDEKAEAILKRAVQNLGGEKYLNVRSQIGKGKFSLLRDGGIVSFQSFIDVIVFPEKERTEFKGSGQKTVQTNFGDQGWIFDGATDTINDQNDTQVANFKRGIRVSLDNLLRGNWRKEGAKLEYAGRRQAGLGRRNDVVKLTFEDGFEVEFEFSDEGIPSKSIYKRTNSENEEITEEDRYAQFVDIQGIKTPFIIDHFSNGVHTSRINYESLEYNKPVSDSIFDKPANIKELKKDLKL